MVFCNNDFLHFYSTSSCHNPYFNRWFSAIECIIVCITQKGTVTILILIDGFLQLFIKLNDSILECVTIIILIDGFLQ